MKRNVKEQELTNKEYDHLTLLEPIRERGHIRWRCRCRCGKEVTRLEYCILRGTATSCGCQHPRRKKGSDHLSYRGCGELNGQYFGHLKRMAAIRDHDFEVTIEELWELFKKQDDKCALTGLPIHFESFRNKAIGVEQSASLDRIDSSKGYVPGNVQWVHKDVNVMKNDYPEDRFIEVCNLVTAFKGNRFPTCTEQSSRTACPQLPLAA